MLYGANKMQSYVQKQYLQIVFASGTYRYLFPKLLYLSVPKILNTTSWFHKLLWTHGSN
jgi:hypothetical protein